MIKKHEAVTNNPPRKIYVGKIENRITYEIKTGYYLKLLTPETIKLLGYTKSKIIKDESGENVPYLKIIALILVHFNIANNDYQLLNNSPKKFILKTFNSEFLWIKVWFADQNSKSVQIDDTINITLVIN